MKIVKTLLALLLCILYTTAVFGAVMDREQFFDLGNGDTVARIEIIEKATGNIVNIVKQEELNKTYEILKKMKFGKIMTYDAYQRDNSIGTSDYSMNFYQKNNVVKQLEITQDKIYTNKWVLFPQQMPNDFYYFAKYMILTKQNYKKTFTEEDFYQNNILWKDNAIIFTKNQPYYEQNNGVMAEFKTLNTVLDTNAVYNITSQTVIINGQKKFLFGQQKDDVVYISVEQFSKLLGYTTAWDNTLKILTIQQPKNHNERWEKLRGIPEVYGNIKTIFEDMSFEKFLNIQQQPLTKVSIKNEKTNYTTTITEQKELEKIYDILCNTTIYQIEKQNIQADEPIYRYAVTLYQNEKAVKTFFMTSENVMKDDIYRVSVSTAFFDYIYKTNETAYAKAVLYQWKVI
ncbi:hypothetical protein [Clostridium sp. MD294]|uniref:hypothetical protein n=1 Tax=Clostridium sp. MD294 TaxID=97138 RepID=UPI0002CA1D4A|nr:hypothetical protein [Clostridium sp. MD294]NDO46706.1 hypothetical protein [Clostridium sp. MD294]USF28856.1 hypothetical protein C820_000230 [Clostridium sp. MD294]